MAEQPGRPGQPLSPTLVARLITVKRAAAIAQVTPKTIYRLIREGKLSRYGIGPRSTLVDYREVVALRDGREQEQLRAAAEHPAPPPRQAGEQQTGARLDRLETMMARLELAAETHFDILQKLLQNDTEIDNEIRETLSIVLADIHSAVDRQRAEVDRVVRIIDGATRSEAISFNTDEAALRMGLSEAELLDRIAAGEITTVMEDGERRITSRALSRWYADKMPSTSPNP